MLNNNLLTYIDVDSILELKSISDITILFKYYICFSIFHIFNNVQYLQSIIEDIEIYSLYFDKYASYKHFHIFTDVLYYIL